MARSKRFIQFLISLSIIVSGCTSLHDNVSAGLGMKPEPTEPTFYLPKRDIVKVDRKGSLWPVEGSKNFLFSDRKAKEVGDIITVNVIEKTSASKSASTKSDRGSSADASVTTLFGIPLDLGITDFLGLGNSFSPGVKGEYASSFDGSGSTERSDDFTAKITVQVVEVFPNGNLTIEGYREVIVNHERQLLFLK
ncbi:MAG: flagellar basal body L-ring protein FlgH, partial [Thermodesulfobacteriota bacterium]